MNKIITGTVKYMARLGTWRDRVLSQYNCKLFVPLFRIGLPVKHILFGKFHLENKKNHVNLASFFSLLRVVKATL